MGVVRALVVVGWVLVSAIVGVVLVLSLVLSFLTLVGSGYDRLSGCGLGVGMGVLGVVGE